MKHLGAVHDNLGGFLAPCIGRETRLFTEIFHGFTSVPPLLIGNLWKESSPFATFYE